jgi:hypothetical protein
MSTPDDFPKSGEDRLLQAYWEQHPRQGTMWLEVPVSGAGPGDWPNLTSARRLDAVLIPGSKPKQIRLWDGDHVAFDAAVANRAVELIESKATLTMHAIGQAVAAPDFFSRCYPNHGRLLPVITVSPDPDAALEWVCNQRGIMVSTHDVGIRRDSWLRPE